tara:strand:- start:1851 stop:2171 length:321 start_codon:yes stop_codon:yes gene_type:complete
MEETDRIKEHPSGLKYYSINLTATDDSGQTMELRLFESLKNERLKWKDDEETFDEYKIRRRYRKQWEKQKKANTLVWNSSIWGTVTPEKALQVHKLIEEQIKQKNG